ncbi:transposase [Cohnella silvisoli]|uniref:IS1595 family transposase n=1 Tax=Cohnella silvisoli TaxID=2873699 RepID=A0ABV1KU72_9BACL|nr:transposase [Cohnella silvisoli]MCD9023172.1 transposase [Cohnella silvisoli]
MFPDHLTFEAFCQQFNSEQACAEALFEARWPDGFRCPTCCHPHFYLIQTRRLPLYECRSCRHQTSVIAGTIMEGSSTLLTRWFQAMFLISRPSGISASRLSQVIQVTYKTAWLIARKIRHALQQADEADPLTGVVRVDPISYGYTYYSEAQQPLLIGGSLDERDEPQQVKIKQPDPSHVNNALRWIEKPGVQAFVDNHIDEQAVTVLGRGRLHPALNPIKWKVTAWLNFTFNGIGAKHLQAYLDEFCFRLNLKLRHAPVFSQLLHWCAVTPTLTYKDLTRSKPVLTVPWVVWGSKAKWKGKYLTLWIA